MGGHPFLSVVTIADTAATRVPTHTRRNDMRKFWQKADIFGRALNPLVKPASTAEAADHRARLDSPIAA